ncbi:MAG: hypothetical protein M1823_005958 [Watsoniomyces obsoletus]|nr:MAG: hypothetical protein M1823_005958 [Watsoniomyces obsoletus]
MGSEYRTDTDPTSGQYGEVKYRTEPNRLAVYEEMPMELRDHPLDRGSHGVKTHPEETTCHRLSQPMQRYLAMTNVIGGMGKKRPVMATARKRVRQPGTQSDRDDMMYEAGYDPGPSMPPQGPEQQPRSSQTVEPEERQSRPRPPTVEPLTEVEEVAPKKTTAKRPKEPVPVKPLKLPVAIRAMQGSERYPITQALDLPITMSLKQYLDKSEAARKELAWMLQSTATKYRVKKVSKTGVIAGHPAAAATTQHYDPSFVPPPITANALKDDNQARAIFITSWIGKERLDRTLVDGGSMVELVSQHILDKLNDVPVHHNEQIQVSLANDKRIVLDKYVYLPVNVCGVCASIKAYVLPVSQGYQLLLGLRWLRRIRMNVDFAGNFLKIRGTDDISHSVPTRLAPPAIQNNLPRISRVEELSDDTDVEDLLQGLIDEGEELDDESDAKEAVKGRR